MPQRTPHVHVWVPGLGETGGIQHYSESFILALRDQYPGVVIDVLSKNDIEMPAIKGIRKSLCFGRLPKKLRTAAFASAGIGFALLDRPDATISTHLHFAPAQAIAERLCGIPFVTCAHGIETWNHLHGTLLYALKQAAGILPVSEFTRQALIKKGGLDADKIIVVPNTFREDVFTLGPKSTALLKKYGLRVDQPVLLTVGRLAADEAYKGQDTVIASLQTVRQNFPDVKYLIVGTGSDEERLRKCARAHGQEDAVIFAGFVSNADLPSYYRLCDAFVMPSTGEGFGIVYLEALACGRPCIVGICDASPEAIGGGRLGFAIDPHSPAEVALAVGKLLSRKHEKPWLDEPTTLREETIARFGFMTFKESLSQSLGHLIPAFNTGSRTMIPS